MLHQQRRAHVVDATFKSTLTKFRLCFYFDFVWAGEVTGSMSGDTATKEGDRVAQIKVRRRALTVQCVIVHTGSSFLTFCLTAVHYMLGGSTYGDGSSEFSTGAIRTS